METLEDLQARIAAAELKNAQLESTLAAMIGRNKAFEYALRTLLTVYGPSERMQAAWTAVLLKIVDAHIDTLASHREHFQSALQQGLAEVTYAIEHPAQRG